MKSVLLIDASPMFTDFLKEKLEAEHVHVETASGKRDAYTRLINILPDLVIINIAKDLDELDDFLEKKRSDPNAHGIPIIISGPVIERKKVALLAHYGVMKYFTKPIKFDIYFASVSKILKKPFSMDTTPCILQMHINENIIFIEIAQGLNKEKISLLKYKLPQVMNSNNINHPKIIIMMTALQLSFMDGANLEQLLDNVIADNRVQNKNVKVLSFDTFTKELIEGHPSYVGITVATRLSDVLETLVDSSTNTNLAELVANRILDANGQVETGEVGMRFVKDLGSRRISDSDRGLLMEIAVIDGDGITRKTLQEAFAAIGGKVLAFSNGTDFMDAVSNGQKFDAVILNLDLVGMTGTDVLKNLQRVNFSTPILIYSQAVEKETIVTSMTLGASSFLIKPQKPGTIIRKVLDIISHEQ
ncbi:MAG: response regulator [Treponema sp.]|nr:response regulator [Treponema sp.]